MLCSILLLTLAIAVVPGRVIEDTASGFDCSNLPEGKFYGDAEDCATYHLCLVGRAFTLTCPDGLYWDQGKKVCNQKAKVACKSSQRLTTVGTSLVKMAASALMTGQGTSAHACQDGKEMLATNNPCENGGNCMVIDNIMSCVCPIGWSGKNCEVSTSCQSNPCLNGGFCVQEPTGFSCTCQTGWVGDFCQFGCQDPPSLFTCPDTWSLKWLDGTGIRHLTGNDSAYCADVFCYPPYFTGFAGSPTYLHERVELDRVHAFQALRYMTEIGQDINSENGLALQHVFFSVLDYAERRNRSGERVWRQLGPIRMPDGTCCPKYGLGTYYRATEAFHFMGML
uniref:chitinase n=1 Tax=Branchiostoma floridae TaxID=7739 RepID=C3Y501_BRAFL|eukprot:XP_002608524.1 hypothetical protein BRAFLDRAFT_92394 [Branchiostoma floridae]